jgi:hypothetical protein
MGTIRTRLLGVQKFSDILQDGWITSGSEQRGQVVHEEFADIVQNLDVPRWDLLERGVVLDADGAERRNHRQDARIVNEGLLPGIRPEFVVEGSDSESLDVTDDFIRLMLTIDNISVVPSLEE